jgi:D-3-phosphoglycerate dehydrogenase
MIRHRVAISTSSFAEEDRTPLDILRNAGFEVLPNPHGRRLTEDEAIDLLRGVDGLIAGLEPLTRRVLESADRLKAIARVGIGLDNVDMQAASDLGIRVSNTPDGPTTAVAELTVAAALTVKRHIVGLNAAMHEGQWNKQIAAGLAGARVLLIGFGRIGRAVADRLRAFQPNLYAFDPCVPIDAPDVEAITLDAGLRTCDLISLHASGLKCILGRREFGLMQDGVTILNGARGELIDEAALIEALVSGKVAGAWFDVFWHEPYTGPLVEYPQVLLTPHVGTYTRQCRREMELAAVNNALRDLQAVAG